MKYTVFNKEINIPDEIIQLFEDNLEPVNNRKAEYLAYVEGGDGSLECKEIENKIIKGMINELSLYAKTSTIETMARIKDYI